MGGEGWLENAKEKRVARQWRTRGLPFPVWEPRGASPTAQHGSSPPSLYYGNFLAEELFFAGRKRIRYRFLPTDFYLRSLAYREKFLPFLDPFFWELSWKKQLSLFARHLFSSPFSFSHGFRFFEGEQRKERERERERQAEGYNCASWWSLSRWMLMQVSLVTNKKAFVKGISLVVYRIRIRM